MREISILIQIVIAAGIANVWLLRFGKPTPYRPGDAASLKEEFAKYGYPDWLRIVVGTAKITLATLLVIGIWYSRLAAIAGGAMALLMLAAVISHIRVGDPPKKSLPALTMLALSVYVAWANGLF